MSETSGLLSTGQKTAVGTTAVPITTRNIFCVFGVRVRACDTCANKVYVGPKGVTNGILDITDGYRLSASESVFIPIDDPRKIYVIGTHTNQAVSWIAI